MATTKPRLQITLKPETKEIIEYTAAQMEIPESRLVSQVLEEAQDSIFQIGKAIETAKVDRVRALRQMAERLDQASDLADSAKTEIQTKIEGI